MTRSSPADAPRVAAPSPVPVPATPLLAVVVASNRSQTLLQACLDALVPQCAEHDAALIVARAGADGIAELRTAYPQAHFVVVARDADIPRLRGAGLDAARAVLTALTEDHCVAAPGWLAALGQHLNDDAAVVGGGMDNLRPRAVDWGAYFSEYGFFDATRPDGTGVAEGVPLLTGANVAYRDTVRGSVAEWMLAGDWENTVHRRLMQAGHRLVFDRAMRVAQNQTYRFLSFCTDRFEHGVDYARTRAAGSSPAQRAARVITTPALPVLLTWRVAGAAARERAATFVRALPATVAFLTAWSLGEAVGYVRGRAS